MENTISSKISSLHNKAEYKTVALADIICNPKNDYQMINIDELAEDIKRNGLLHNLVVVPTQESGKYKLLAGERRFKALQKLNESEPEKWGTVHVLVYTGLTERQEEIIMDSSNLQARSSGGNEEQLRKATNRYMDNLKAEFGISEKQALKEATDVYSGSGNTIRTNRKIGQNLNEDFTDELDKGKIGKGDAAVIADMNEDEQDNLFDEFESAETEEEKQAVITNAVNNQKEKSTKAKAEKKSGKQPKETEESEVTTSYVDPRITTRINYIEKVTDMTEQIKALNNQDTVAQIARLDKCADEDKADKVLAKVNQLLVELTAFKNAIKESDGEFEIPIDPVHGHRMGNKDEEGYAG